jgi:superfamily II DNA or RNA helicase
MRGIAKVVTGAGKTSFAMMCMEQYFALYPKGRCTILVPSIALLDQWYVDLIDETSIESKQISVYGGGSSPSAADIVNLMTMNTAREVATDIVREGDLLIVDECHRAASPENSRAITHDKQLFSLGLSATPERQYDEGFNEVLVPKLGSIIIDYDYKQARADGVICDFVLYNVKVEMDEGETEEYSILSKLIAIAVSKEGSESEEFRNLCMKRAKLAAETKMRIPTARDIVISSELEKSLIFHESIASAEKIAKLLNDRGHYALTYHSKLSDAVRRDNLLKFKQGTCNVLVTCRALDEGANIPEANLGVIAASTKSYRQRIQRLGRLLRNAPGKESAAIYTIYSTDSEEELLIAEAKELEGATEVKWLGAKLS